MRRADHAEQRGRLVRTVDRPAGVEDLVPAVFRVRLREHHELDIGRIALHRAVRIEQVVDLVGRQRQAECAIRVVERATPLRADRHAAHRLARQVAEQQRRIGIDREHAFGHAIVQQRSQSLPGAGIERAGTEQSALAFHEKPRAAFNAQHRLEPAVVRDVGGLAGPRRDRAEARHHQPGCCGLRRRGERRAVLQQSVEPCALARVERALQVHEVHMLAVHRADARLDRLKAREQLARAKCRKRTRTVECETRVG